MSVRMLLDPPVDAESKPGHQVAIQDESAKRGAVEHLEAMVLHSVPGLLGFSICTPACTARSR